MNRQLRARLLLEEARALGLDVADLVAAATGEPKPVTVAAWIDEIAPTVTPATAATYRPYWCLTARLLGDRYLAELTSADLAVVVDVAAERARSHRPDSTGRASRETCIAALRALYARAVDAGHLTTNPAAALRKPLRTTSRRRALDDRELTELADAVRATSADPDLDLLLIRFHLETGARRQGASTSGAATSTPTGPRSGFARRTTPNASNPSPFRSSPCWSRTLPIEEATAWATPSSGTDEVSRSRAPLRPLVRPCPPVSRLGRPHPGVSTCAPPHGDHPDRAHRRLHRRAGLRRPRPTDRDRPLPACPPSPTSRRPWLRSPAKPTRLPTPTATASCAAALTGEDDERSGSWRTDLRGTGTADGARR